MRTDVFVDEVSLSEVRRLVDAANAARRQSDASGVAVGSYDGRAERRLDALFGTGRTLAVYGTLAAASGLLSSWARPAESLPRAAIFSCCRKARCV